MRFLGIYSITGRKATPSTQDEIARMGGLIEESTKNGALLSTEGCLPSPLRVRVRLSDEKFTVTGGPSTESKEVVGGFAILRCDSKAEVIDLAKRFLEVAGDGETKIWQLHEAHD